MAQARDKNTEQKKRKVALTETQQWIVGITLFAFGLYLLTAIVSYYFTWADDQSFVGWGRMGAAADISNLAGKYGAVMANWFVGELLGVFAVAIPVVLLILAVRVIDIRPLFLRKSVRISLIIMILGSLSLGFLFKDSWGVFGSGLGGRQGIVMSAWMEGYLGKIGTLLLLLLGWVLIGVYISKKTISVVNNVGKGIFDGGVRIGGTVIDHAVDLVNRGAQKEEQEETGIDTPAEVPCESAPAEVLSVVEPGAEAEEPILTPGKQITTINDMYSRGSEFFEITDARRREKDGGETMAAVPGGASAGAAANVVSGVGGAESLGSTGSGIVVMDGGAGNAGGGVGSAAPKSAAGGNVVTFGDDAGDFMSRRDAGRVSAADDSRYAGGVGEFAGQNGQNGQDAPRANGRPAGEVVEVRQTQDGVFEIVETGGTVSVGGVLESSSPGGVRPGDKLEVVVSERRDVLLAEDEIDSSLYDPTLELSKYQKPPVEILEDHSIDVQVTEEEIYQNKNQIVKTLENFGIKIDKIKATIGPTVTLYEIVPAAGVKISKIKNLEDDIALSLKALGIRIIAPMPGKGTVGIEVPNKDKEIVSMYSLVRTKKFQESEYELPVVLGKNISNELYMIDLAKMPHLLVAGATGQGKSVGLNTIITSLLYKKHPGELKFVMVDPKRVELSLYARLEKHFLAKMESEDDAILTDTQKVVYTLNSLCKEMSDRYDLLRLAEVKKISEYNDKFRRRRLNPQKGHRFMPYIVVVIDEFADMIMTAGREVEAPITRLAQLARAVGIHLVIATQRPDVKVITGLIKANFPARIAFRVMSMVDSRTIIDQPGANQLIGRGDMLMSLNGELTRVQCAFIDTPEIERVAEFISGQRGYASAYNLPDYVPDSESGAAKNVDLGQIDPMFEEVARFVVQNQQGSTSSIQRRFSIGYNRAGRIMDQLEGYGIVGRAEGSKPREVLIVDVMSLEHILSRMDE